MSTYIQFAVMQVLKLCKGLQLLFSVEISQRVMNNALNIDHIAQTLSLLFRTNIISLLW